MAVLEWLERPSPSLWARPPAADHGPRRPPAERPAARHREYGQGLCGLRLCGPEVTGLQLASGETCPDSIRGYLTPALSVMT